MELEFHRFMSRHSKFPKELVKYERKKNKKISAVTQSQGKEKIKVLSYFTISLGNLQCLPLVSRDMSPWAAGMRMTTGGIHASTKKENESNVQEKKIALPTETIYYKSVHCFPF